MDLNKEDIACLDREYRRNLINSLLGYKHALLIGTTNEAGQHNLAIFTQVIHVGAAPPLIGVLFRPHTVARHTLENIRATGQFTINQVPEAIFRQAHQTSANYALGVSEFEATGITPQVISPYQAPFVTDAGVKILCSLAEEIKLERNGTILVVGSVDWISVTDMAVGKDGFINHQALHSIAAAGLDAYYTGEVLSRLSYARVEE